MPLLTVVDETTQFYQYGVLRNFWCFYWQCNGSLTARVWSCKVNCSWWLRRLQGLQWQRPHPSGQTFSNSSWLSFLCSRTSALQHVQVFRSDGHIKRAGAWCLWLFQSTDVAMKNPVTKLWNVHVASLLTTPVPYPQRNPTKYATYTVHCQSSLADYMRSSVKSLLKRLPF